MSAQQLTHARQSEALRRAMGAEILAPLDDPKVVEIMLNPDGTLWVDRLGEGMRQTASIDAVRALTIVNTVAAMLNTVVTPERPILECELPLDGSRFEALIPPLVERASFALRKKATLVFSLADYVAKGIMTQAQMQGIEQAVASRHNVLVSGGTGCHEADAPILMFDGSTRRAADVRVGDRLMGPDCLPRTVQALHSGIDDMVRIKPIKSEPMIVNAGHILSLVWVARRRGRPRGVMNMPVRLWLQMSEEFQSNYMMRRAAVDWSDKEKARWRARANETTMGRALELWFAIEPVGFSIEPVGTGRYYGFEVDGDHLYLDGQFFIHHNTGKTTLANAILDAVARLDGEHRVVVIEDTRELQVNAENVVFLRTSDNTDMTRLLRATMRLRPDRIVVGEVRDGSALALLKAWNTGHPGGVGTVHANDASAALIRIGQLIQEAGVPPNPELIAEAVNVVVSIKRTAEGRRVEEVAAVRGWSASGGFHVERIA